MLDPVAHPTIATVVEPSLRSTMDAAGQGRFEAVHAETVRDVLRTVRERPVRAVFVSPGRVAPRELPGVAALIGSFPAMPTVAVVNRHDPSLGERLLDLGAHGIRKLVDLSDRDGWSRLRELVSHPTSPTAARIFGQLMPALEEATPDCRSVFELIVRQAPVVVTVSALTEFLGVRPSTFMSRYFRAGLPSPKRYLSGMRLVYAAGLLETRGLSISDVAYRLQYSSPQSFGRHLRNSLGITASEFRRRFSLESALYQYMARLIVPHQKAFRTFHPLDTGVGYLGQTW